MEKILHHLTDMYEINNGTFTTTGADVFPSTVLHPQPPKSQIFSPSPMTAPSKVDGVGAIGCQDSRWPTIPEGGFIWAVYVNT